MKKGTAGEGMGFKEVGWQGCGGDDKAEDFESPKFPKSHLSAIS